MTLRERCEEMYLQLSRDAVLRQGDPVEDLMAFVIAERGRAADWSLRETMPLCLYFGSDKDREEFITLFHVLRPGMIAKKMP